ncbi:MAG: hypothetical protein IAC69_03435 [Proteobacteria bacterium]|uniref:Superinfection immunity protein n=1 Tax=Candidatus Enterousia avistercoris TaxID=2840788 RepID=A0A9D9DEY8_9PROT|nr:hypothetical protein [Candidatus Enterousia avistercoris]
MIFDFNIVLTFKYIVAIAITLAIILSPAWIARQTGRAKNDMILVRLASWLFLWTGVGWLWALFWSAKK